MPRSTALRATLTVMALASAGCTPGQTTQPSTIASVICGDAIDLVAEVPDNFQLVGENSAVVSVSLDRFAIGARDTDGSAADLRFSKIPIALRNGEQVTISLKSSTGLLSWGGSMLEPVETVTAGPCEAINGDGTWHVFAGGVYVMEPSCVLLVFTDEDGDSETTELPIGRSCGRK